MPKAQAAADLAEDAALSKLWKQRFQIAKPVDHFTIVRDILMSCGVSAASIDAAVDVERQSRGLPPKASGAA